MLNNIINDLNLDKEKYLIVGCSAGPDSMALLHYLKNNTKNNIVCAHINHNIRKESKTEENEPKKKPRERLILTILDGKNGKILEEKIIENIEMPSVRYLFNENYGLISYTKINKGFKRNEILSFELMNKYLTAAMKREDTVENLSRYERQQELERQKKVEKLEKRSEKLADMQREKQKINNQKRTLGNNLAERKK